MNAYKASPGRENTVSAEPHVGVVEPQSSD